MPVQECENLFEFKEDENCNRPGTICRTYGAGRNTWEYFEDYNLSLTQKSGKLAIYGWALDNTSIGIILEKGK